MFAIRKYARTLYGYGETKRNELDLIRPVLEQGLDFMMTRVTNSKKDTPQRRTETRAQHIQLNYEFAQYYRPRLSPILNLMQNECVPHMTMSTTSYTENIENTPGHTIYALINAKDTSKYYVGRTGNSNTRRNTHKNDAKHCKFRTATQQQKTYAHEFMARFDVDSWILLPILIGIDPQNIKRVEKNIIKRLSPPLNTQFLRNHYRKDKANFAWSDKAARLRNTTEIHTSKRPQNKRRHARRNYAKFHPREKENEPELKPGFTLYTLKRFDDCTIYSESYKDSQYDLEFLIAKAEERTFEATKETHFKISWERKKEDLTPKQLLKFHFGTAVVANRKPGLRVRQTERTLQESIKMIMSKPTGTIRLWNLERHKKVRELAPKRLEQLVRFQTVRNKTAKSIAFDDLVDLRQHVKRLGGKKAKQTARSFVDNTLKKRFNVKLKKRMIISIPFTEGLPVKELTGLIDRILLKSDLHGKLKMKYRPGIRFVYERRESVGDLFTNNIKFIRKLKSFDKKKIRKMCVCKQIDPDLSLPRDEKGHICCKMNESNERIGNILNISTKNIPKPSKMNHTEELDECVIKFAAQIKSMLNPKLRKRNKKRLEQRPKEKETKMMKNDQPRSNGKEKKESSKTKEKKCSGKRMIEELTYIGISPNFVKEIRRQIKTIAQTIKTHDKESNSPPDDHLQEKELRRLKNEMKGLIFSPLDKNTGCMCISCPVAYVEAVRKTFRNDSDHYEQLSMEPEEIVKKYRRFYEETGEQISKVPDSKFEKTNLPYAYTLHKNKDLKKLRPIVSYATHPLKRTLNITCRALNHMIKMIDKDHALHCNMETCVELKERLKDIENRMREAYGPRTRFSFIMGDVKNMYTELTHGTIKKAVQWLMEETKKQTRRTELTVKRVGKQGVSFGRATNTASSITITMKQIMEVVEFDLANAIFAVGSPDDKNNIYRQFVGVPMGSPLSPALAKLTCMYFENILFQKIKHDKTCKLEGLRFMDDLIAIGIYDYKSEEGKKNIAQHMSDLTTCYDDGMILEIEAQSGIGKRSKPKETAYLQSNLVFKKNTIEMYEKNKNEESIRKTGKQKLLRYPHIRSYASKSQKQAICVQGAIAIDRYSTTRDCKLIQFMKMTKEMAILGYTQDMLRSTLFYMKSKYDQETWTFIHRNYEKQSQR